MSAAPTAEPRAAAPADAAPRRANWGEIAALALVAFVIALPLRGLFRAPGPPMEEGFMLVFPEQVLHGAIPNRDFLHLYGPGSLWTLAGIYKVFGVSLWSERVFGLLQQCAIVFGVYAIARRWNRVLAVTGAITAAFIIVPFGLTALAWIGAVGLGVLAIVCGITSLERDSAPRWALASGLLLGLAVLFRLDLVVATALSGFALWRVMARPARTRLLTGYTIGVVPYLVQLATAGVGNSVRGMVLDPVFHLRGGRSLPIPPPWDHLATPLQRASAIQLITWRLPAPRASQQLFFWFFLLLATIVFVAYAGWSSVRANPSSLRSRALFVTGLFCLGITPQALQRVDSAHFAWVGCVPFGILPVAMWDVVQRRVPRLPERRGSLAAGALALALVIFVFPAYTVTRYSDYVLQTFNAHRHSYPIDFAGRHFSFGTKDRAEAANQVIRAAALVSKPGDRLFVGPGELRKTPYSDAYLYYMLPKLKPATYYIEMDPGMANAEDSGLDRDLASADTVILSKIWDNWDEPNDSQKFGSAKPVAVLQRDFCQIGDFMDTYLLYRKCH